MQVPLIVWFYRRNCFGSPAKFFGKLIVESRHHFGPGFSTGENGALRLSETLQGLPQNAACVTLQRLTIDFRHLAGL
jgi:hypothetical protein